MVPSGACNSNVSDPPGTFAAMTDDRTGVRRIYDERNRQTFVEGWTPEHDDEHTDGELSRAASCYAEHAHSQVCGGTTGDADADRPDVWPWAPGWWKPSDDPIRNLEKAGALIAAEIDRLVRAGG